MKDALVKIWLHTSTPENIMNLHIQEVYNVHKLLHYLYM